MDIHAYIQTHIHIEVTIYREITVKVPLPKSCKKWTTGQQNFKYKVYLPEKIGNVVTKQTKKILSVSIYFAIKGMLS